MICDCFLFPKRQVCLLKAKYVTPEMVTASSRFCCLAYGYLTNFAIKIYEDPVLSLEYTRLNFVQNFTYNLPRNVKNIIKRFLWTHGDWLGENQCCPEIEIDQTLKKLLLKTE